jgi:hypothetical protein
VIPQVKQADSIFEKYSSVQKVISGFPIIINISTMTFLSNSVLVCATGVVASDIINFVNLLNLHIYSSKCTKKL